MLILVVQDGTIDKNDLRGAFDNVGVLMTESELDELLGEVQEYITPLNFRFCNFWLKRIPEKSFYQRFIFKPHTALGTF